MPRNGGQDPTHRGSLPSERYARLLEDLSETQRFHVSGYADAVWEIESGRLDPEAYPEVGSFRELTIALRDYEKYGRPGRYPKLIEDYLLMKEDLIWTERESRGKIPGGF